MIPPATRLRLTRPLVVGDVDSSAAAGAAATAVLPAGSVAAVDGDLAVASQVPDIHHDATAGAAATGAGIPAVNAVGAPDMDGAIEIQHGVDGVVDLQAKTCTTGSASRAPRPPTVAALVRVLVPATRREVRVVVRRPPAVATERCTTAVGPIVAAPGLECV